MRILVVAQQWFPDYTGGTARVATATAQALAARGHDVVALAPAVTGQPPVESTPGLSIKRTIRRRSYLPQTYTETVAVRQAARDLDLGSFDVALCHHVTGVVAISRAAPSLPVAYVFHASPYREAIHRRSTGLHVVASLRSRIVEPRLANLERTAARAASSILVLSEYSQSLVVTDHGDRDSVFVVGGGVDTNSFRPAGNRQELRSRLGLADEEISIVTVRRLVARMGVEHLLESFAAIMDDGRTKTLTIIGDGELKGALTQRAASLGIAEHVHFAGRVSDEGLVAWLQASDLFVLPTQAYEGFGMVTAEALACGTPVVGTPVGATPEVLAPFSDALVTNGATAADIERGIRKAERMLTPELRVLARQYATSTLSWDAAIQRWEAALANTVGLSANPASSLQP